MSSELRKAFILVIAILLVAGGTVGWLWQSLITERAAAAADKERAVLLEKHVEELRQDLKRLQERLDKYTASEKQAKELETRKDIENQVAAIRHLPFKEPVQYQTIDRSNLSKVLHQKIDEQYSKKDLQNMELSLAAMGLIPPGTDIRNTLIDLLAEQVGAFFDQHAHKLFMFTGSSLENHQDRIILAHELTHALQDQHFKLSTFPLEVKDNDDLVLATSALVEGDATLLMSQFMIDNFSLATLRDSVGGMLKQDMRKLANAPLFLRESLLFPYLRGQEFAIQLYAEGGWDRLTEAFKDPPKSTSQILHPEKYLSIPREDPIPVQFESATVNGQEPAASNVMGEFGVRTLFSEWLSNKEAERAGEGWRGDRYLVFGTATEYHVLWKTLWSSARDAEEFRVAELRALKKRYQLPKELDETIKPDAPIVYDGTRSIRLIRQGNAVVTVDAANPQWAETLVRLGGN